MGATGTVRTLGIDTSLRCTGIGVVEKTGSRFTAVEHGELRNPDRIPLSDCLVRLQDGVRQAIERTHPDSVAVEGIFFCKNVRTAMILGHARGAVIAACAAAGLPIFEYPPRRVKQALSGNGAAEKAQVRKMVMTILGLREEPREDAGDALAIAICHLNQRPILQDLAGSTRI